MKGKKIQDLKEKGITLIALVVTIIILLILAGVTLNMALSGDGLFNKARKAATDYNQKSVEEKLQILYAEKIMEDVDNNSKVKTDVTDVLKEMAGGEITEENIEEFNKLLEQYNEKVKGIKTVDELEKIGEDDDYPIDGVYVQLDDIENLTTQISSDKEFTGIYNGNGKKIKQIEITADSDNTGMFGINKGIIKNVTIESCTINSSIKGNIGTIAGTNSGLIENCIISGGTVSATGDAKTSDGDYSNKVGGICGYNFEGGIIQNCENSANITSNSSFTGGICGYSRECRTYKCINKGTVIGALNVGGICGYSHDNLGGSEDFIVECMNEGEVRGDKEFEKDSNCGGIVGFNGGGSIVDCTNMKEVSGNMNCVRRNFRKDERGWTY